MSLKRILKYQEYIYLILKRHRDLRSLSIHNAKMTVKYDSNHQKHTRIIYFLYFCFLRGKKNLNNVTKTLKDLLVVKPFFIYIIYSTFNFLMKVDNFYLRILYYCVF